MINGKFDAAPLDTKALSFREEPSCVDDNALYALHVRTKKLRSVKVVTYFLVDNMSVVINLNLLQFILTGFNLASIILLLKNLALPQKEAFTYLSLPNFYLFLSQSEKDLGCFSYKKNKREGV